MPPSDSLFYTFHFYLFGVIAIAAAITFVTRKSPVAAALWLVVVMALVFVGLDRGRVISPAYGRISDDQLARLRGMSRRGRLTPQAGD